ncbi:hypothetical protein CVT24_003847 [Panaeolus cyanescens]|uniref:Uncharacterized protein n=1 Tax=Panaeolus cyanescens TaxID=181874 RepID=A0A409WNE1_9AGAR|nr:hypothetical protein CVT24_003847 [Panaeolus cyanescens]
MSPLLSLLFLCIAPVSTFASVVTLYDIRPPQPTEAPPIRSIHHDVSEKYSAINPSAGSDVTTYLVEEVDSNVFLVNFQSTATYTIFSTPVTRSYTVVAGASTWHAIQHSDPSLQPTQLPDKFYYIPSADETTDCSLDVEKNEGSCVNVVTAPFPSTTLTFTTSYTGVPVPVATVTDGIAEVSRSGAPRSEQLLATRVAAISLAILFGLCCLGRWI